MNSSPTGGNPFWPPPPAASALFGAAPRPSPGSGRAERGGAAGWGGSGRHGTRRDGKGRDVPAARRGGTGREGTARPSRTLREDGFEPRCCDSAVFLRKLLSWRKARFRTFKGILVTFSIALPLWFTRYLPQDYNQSQISSRLSF